MADEGGPGPAGVLEGDAPATGPGPWLNEASPGATDRGPTGLTEEVSYESALADFKRKVREQQITDLIAKGRVYFADVPNSELEKIEGKHRMRKAAAARCRELLAAARAAHKKNTDEGDAVAADATSIGIKSAYRSIPEDTIAWENTFTKHFNAMKKKKKFVGKELSDAAFNYMVVKMRKFKAPPGYSNHSNGKAVDFRTKQGGIDYVADSSQREGWRNTWLHAWLTVNAKNFDFKPLDTEEWHWDYTK